MGNAFSSEVGIVPMLSLIVSLFALYGSLGTNLGWWPFPSKSEELTVKMYERDVWQHHLVLAELMQSKKLLKEQNKHLKDISRSIDTIAKKIG